MLGMLGGLVDKQKLIRDYLENTIEDVSEELKVKPCDLFIMIKPKEVNDNTFKVLLYLSKENSPPKFVRAMSVAEFVDEQNE